MSQSSASSSSRHWVRSWLLTLAHGSVFTRSGRELRRRVREPFDPNDYIEVERPRGSAR